MCKTQQELATFKYYPGGSCSPENGAFIECGICGKRFEIHGNIFESNALMENHLREHLENGKLELRIDIKYSLVVSHGEDRKDIEEEK